MLEIARGEPDVAFEWSILCTNDRKVIVIHGIFDPSARCLIHTEGIILCGRNFFY